MRKLKATKRFFFVILMLDLALMLGLERGATAQEGSTQPVAPNATIEQSRQNPNPDLTPQELAKMDQFLDDHRDINRDLEKNPSLVNDNKYLDHHKDLKMFFSENPRVHNEFVENPNYFMHRENRLEVRESSQFRSDLGRPNPNPDLRRPGGENFDQFLDSHREIAEQVRKNPSLLDNREFVQNHPALQAYLQSDPSVRDQLRQDPNAFLRNEEHFDRTGEGEDRDAPRRDSVDFNRFLDNHREIAEQVRKNPSLVDNREFVQNHPALQAYLQDNPSVHDQLRQDPKAFSQPESHFDQAANGHDRDTPHERMANFGEFLGSHPNIAQDVSKNPSLVKNQEYVDNHRDLGEYLNAHPQVKNEWAANPQGFVRGSQQFGNTAGTTGSANRVATSRPSANGTNPGTSTTGNSTSTQEPKTKQ